MRSKTWHLEWHGWDFFFITELLEKTEIKRCRLGRDFITRINLYTYFEVSRKSNNLTKWHQIKACRHKFCFWALICKGESTRGAHFGGFIRNNPGSCTRSKVTPHQLKVIYCLYIHYISILSLQGFAREMEAF